MGVPGNADLLLLRSAAAAGGYQVERSLRFNSSDSAYLSRTPASAGNRKTWTWAAWVKRSGSGVAQAIFGEWDSGASNGLTAWFQANDTLVIQDYGPGVNFQLTTTQVFRDFSAWFHLLVAVDTTQATASNRVKVYVNGTQVTTFSAETYPTQNLDTQFNRAQATGIGRSGAYSAGYYFNGYLADIHFIDGQALDPSSFTEVSATTGQLIPKAYTGSFGTNGFWLKFSDNSAATATTLGKDYSGNNNNWTPNNLSVTAGAGNDSLVDTPTSYGTDTGAGGEVRGNYCTLNPLGTAGATPTNGNLSVSSSSTVGNRISTFFLTNGKWYWEGSGNGYVGAIVGRGGESFTGSISGTGSKAIGWWEGGPVYWDGGDNGGSTTFTSTDVIGIALDMDAGNIKFYKNNSLIYTITFGSGTVPNLSSGVFPAYNVGASTKSVDLNFGQRPFAYTAPSGFKALCDTNLPAPVVAKSSDYFQTVLYTGNGSTQTVSGLSFSPDLVWLKGRSVGYSHQLYDQVRGAGKLLGSNTTNAESTVTDNLTAFTSSGFTLGNDAGTNQSSATYVAWAFDAGTTTTTNTAGSITSQVRANASAGLSIVSWNSTTNVAHTFGHGLGVAPQFVIVKRRGSTGVWRIGHKSIGWTQALQFDTGAALAADGAYWNNTAPTSTVVSIGDTGQLGGDNIAYCWTPVAGYSSAFSYVGSGDTNGPMVSLGFKPRLLLIKKSSAAGDWSMFDTARSPYNLSNQILYSNLSDFEDAGSFRVIDILSNGFKPRGNGDSTNVSGATYIGFAWAESPFQYARAR